MGNDSYTFNNYYDNADFICLLFKPVLGGINMHFTQNLILYIDPATTSYVIQIAVGIMIAGGTAIGIFWNKLKRKTKRKNTEEEPAKRNADRKHGGVITAEELMNDEEEKDQP